MESTLKVLTAATTGSAICFNAALTAELRQKAVGGKPTNREGIWSSFHYGRANCAPANEASQRSARENVANGPFVL
jgi:hypothetical protein